MKKQQTIRLIIMKKLKKISININSIYFILLAFFLIISNSFAEVQWVAKVISYSSQYSDKQYSANQVIGSPSVKTEFGSTPTAWAPLEKRSINGEFIHVEYSNPIKLKIIYINETSSPGSISKIIAYDERFDEHEIYLNEKLNFIVEESRLLTIELKTKTNFKVKQLKIFLDTKKVPGYNQIESIGISENDEDFTIETKEAEISNFKIDKIKLNDYVNSSYSELLPIISSDAKKLFFTRDNHPENFGIERKQDIWYSNIDEYGNFGLPINIGSPINNDDNNFAFSVSVDGNSLLLGNKYNDDGTTSAGVSISTYDGERWSNPKELYINNYRNDSKYSTFFLSNSGKVLLMSLEDKLSVGGTDLYVSFLNDDESWSTPINLGSINTASNEYSPFLGADAKTLYFSSAGYPGYGKNDIFYSKRLDESWLKWSEPLNMGEEINTVGNDSYYSISASGEYAYLVSALNTITYEDIYRINIPKELQPEQVMLVTGKVIDQKTNKPMRAKIIYESLEDGTELGITYSNPLTGEYSITLPKGVKYGVRAELEGFIAVNENIDTDSLNSFEKISKNINIVPLEKGQKILLNNIFFNFAEFSLLKNSYYELDRIVNLLERNKNLNIQINGHSDNNGTKERNMMFSIKRAEAVKDYLLSKGVSGNRIKSKGYGELKPLSSNNTAEGRRKNRRVEFEIINN